MNLIPNQTHYKSVLFWLLLSLALITTIQTEAIAIANGTLVLDTFIEWLLVALNVFQAGVIATVTFIQKYSNE